MAKCNTFVTIKKILGKTHLSKPYKQGLPEGQGRNDVSPLKGIDTTITCTLLFRCAGRNDVSPLKGIDTGVAGLGLGVAELGRNDVSPLKGIDTYICSISSSENLR